MTITFVAAGAASAANSTTTTPARPAGLTTGDIRLMQVYVSGASATTPTPSGWTLAATVARTTTHRQSVFYRVATASESDVAVTASVSGLILARETAWRGCSTTTPLDVAAVTGDGPKAATYAAPGITPVSSGAMAIWCFAKPDDNTIGSATQGTTAYSSDTTTGSDGNIALVYELQSAPADTGTTSMTEGANGTDNWTSITLALRPAAVASANPSVDLFDSATFMVEIAPGGTPLSPSQTWVDVTDDLLDVTPMTVRRGRESEFSENSPSELSLTLNNEDRAYDPDYTSGPYYPNLVPMTPIRVRVRRNSTTRFVFTGLVQSWPQTYYGDHFSTVTVQALDVSTLLATRRLPPTALTVAVMNDEPLAYFPMLEDKAGIATEITSLGADTRYGFLVTSPDSFVQGETSHKAKRLPALSDHAEILPAPLATDLDVIRAFEGWFFSSETGSSGTFTAAALNNQIAVSTAAAGGVTGSGPQLTFTAYDASGSIGNLSWPLGSFTVYHFAATIDDALSTFDVYVNGFQAGTLTISSGTFDGGTRTPYLLALGDAVAGSTIAHFAVYDHPLTQAQILEHYLAGTSGGNLQTVTDRMSDLAEFAGLTDAGLYDDDDLAADTYLGVASYSGDVLTAMQDIMRSDQGRLFVSGAGVLTAQGRVADMDELTANGVSQITFAEMSDPDAVGYSLMDFEPASRDILRNRADVSTASGTVSVVDATSVNRYGEAPQSVSTVLSDPVGARNLGLSILRRHASPSSRITAIVIEPRINPDDLFPFVLDAELGWRVTVQRLPQRVGNTIEQEYAIEGIRHDITPSNWTTTLYLVPAEESYTQRPWFRIGDSTYGAIGVAAGNQIPA